MIDNGGWKDGKNGSRKLKNPGEIYFLKLAAEAIKEVNSMKDTGGLSWSRKPW
jgi:hypothetical protein